MLSAIGEQRRKNINRKQETPKKKRALLARPHSRKFIKMAQIAIAVLAHIGHCEVVGEKKIDQTAESEPDQRADCKAGIARGFDEERAASDDCADSACNCVNRQGESQQKCEQ